MTSSSQARGEIYASIIHDINGPLTIISGFIQLISQRIGDSTQLPVEDLQFIKERLKVITRQVTNCIEISRRYLSFLRRQSQEAPRVGVNQLLADLGQLLRVIRAWATISSRCARWPKTQSCKSTGPISSRSAQPGGQCVPVRPATPSGRGPRPAPVRAAGPGALPGRPSGPPAQCGAVRQYGAAPGGFRRRQRAWHCAGETARIFQPYFTTKGPLQGTGLGLNIVLRLIKAANGILHVHTEAGVGTTFTLYLRAVSAPGKA